MNEQILIWGHPAVEVELWIKRASLLFQTAEADKFLFLLVKLSSRGVLGRNQVSDESFLVHKIVKEAKNFNVTLRSYMSLLSNLTTYWFSIRKSDWNFVLFLKDLITNPFFIRSLENISNFSACMQTFSRKTIINQHLEVLF